MSDTWTELTPMHIGRSTLSAAAFGQKLVVTAGYSAAGGMNGGTAIYDTTTNAWSSGANSQGLDGACSGIVLGRFYLFGGGLFGGVGVTTTQIDDPTTNMWTPGAPMPAVNGQAAGAVYNGKIYCFGGADTLVYSNPATYNTVEIYTP
jgi:N-acetylneuraminic acid mutarotase